MDIDSEHIELRYGDAAKSEYEQWVTIALIGKPTNHVFPVSWLVSPNDPAREPMLAAARKEIDFYLVEKREVNPWGYAQYHCTTAANMYSAVHWSYFPNGNLGQLKSSMVIRVSAGEAE